MSDKDKRYNARRANDPEAMERRKVYDSGMWQAVRRRKLAANPLCEMCEDDNLVVPAEHVDHITPLAEGGAPFDPANLMALCVPCHSRKTAAERTGKRPEYGCCVHGHPRDPLHPWNRPNMSCTVCYPAGGAGAVSAGRSQTSDAGPSGRVMRGRTNG